MGTTSNKLWPACRRICGARAPRTAQRRVAAGACSLAFEVVDPRGFIGIGRVSSSLPLIEESGFGRVFKYGLPLNDL